MKTRQDDPYRLRKRSLISQFFLKCLTFFPLMPSSRGYNLTISKEKRFVWFRVAKICTGTIFNHMKEKGVTLDLAHPYNIHYPLKLYRDYFKFAFVRNPWDRLVSCWGSKVVDRNFFKLSDEEYEKMQTFESFVEYVSGLDIEKCDPHLRLQSRLIDLDHIDYLGRFETFDDDYPFICRKLGISTDGLEHRNKSSREDFRNYYDHKLRDKVYQIYQRDIQIFGYQYD